MYTVYKRELDYIGKELDLDEIECQEELGVWAKDDFYMSFPLIAWTHATL